MSNIVGEDHLDYVKSQINTRQDILGKSNRTSGDIAWMNGRTSWIRLVSSVDIKNSKIPFYDTGSEEWTEIDNNGEEDRNKFLGLEGYSGNTLSNQLVLQGGTLNSDGSQKFGTSETISDLPDLNNSYGFGGNEFGPKPMPGITSFSAKNYNKGSLREGTLTIVAHNRRQFEYLEAVYLRLGYTMLLEWGNSTYPHNENGNIEYRQNRASLKLQFLSNSLTGQAATTFFYTEIERLRKETQGNYDAFLASVQNFSWRFTKDGTYEITLKLITIGSVVDSLKLNVVYDKFIVTTKEGEVKTETEKVNSFLTFLKRFSALDGESTVEVDNMQTFIKSIFSPASLTFASSLTFDIKTQYKPVIKFNGEAEICRATFGQTGKLYKYIRFKSILRILNTFTILDEDEKPALFELDTSPQYCFSNKRSISSDPTKMIISYKNEEEEIEIFADGDAKIEPFHDEIGEIEVGNIMNLYFSYDFLESTVENLVGEDNKDLPLERFIKTLLDTANELLGGVNKLNLRLTNKEFEKEVFNFSTNTTSTTTQIKQVIEFYDEVSPFGVENLNRTNTESKFIVYGVPNSKGSFITDYNFTTTLSGETGAMIAIGAQANGQAVGEDSTLFSKWNYGLVDRILPQKLDLDKEIAETDKVTKGYLDLISLYTKYKELFKNSDASGSVTVVTNNVAGISTSPVDEITFKGYNFPLCNLSTIDNEFSLQGFPSTQKSFFNKFYTLEAISKNTSTPFIGFIPMNLSLTFDGLSGIRIFDKLSIDSKFLPSNYGDTLDFIITAVDHKLEGNKWQTSINTLSKPKNPKKLSLNLQEIVFTLPPVTTGITNLVGYYSYIYSALGTLMKNSFRYRTEIEVKGALNNYYIYSKNTNGGFILPSQNLKALSGGEYFPTPLVEIGKAGGILEVSVPGKGLVKSKGIRFANTDDLRGQDGVFHLAEPAALKLLEFAQFCESKGKKFQINSAYRDYAEQERAKEKYGKGAADPGTSTHGWGGAIDIQELIARDGNGNKTTNVRYNQAFRTTNLDYLFWEEHAPKYGWYNPYKLRDGKLGGRVDESWHWEFWGIPGEQLQIKPPSSPTKEPSNPIKFGHFAEVDYLGFEGVPNTNTLALKTKYTPEVYPNPNGEYPTTTKPEL